MTIARSSILFLAFICLLFFISDSLASQPPKVDVAYSLAWKANLNHHIQATGGLQRVTYAQCLYGVEDHLCLAKFSEKYQPDQCIEAVVSPKFKVIQVSNFPCGALPQVKSILV